MLRHVGTDIPSDLLVQVEDVDFHLHKVAHFLLYIFFLLRGYVFLEMSFLTICLF